MLCNEGLKVEICSKLTFRGSLRGRFVRCWLEFGLSWRMLELCCDIFGSKMAPKSPKMSQDGAQKRQDGAQEATRCSQDGILARFWELLGSIFDDLGGFLAVRLNIKNLEKLYVFNCFLKVWDPERKPHRRKSGQEGHVQSKLRCLGRSWLQVELSWKML